MCIKTSIFIYNENKYLIEGFYYLHKNIPIYKQRRKSMDISTKEILYYILELLKIIIMIIK